jgi:hypothetical protein
MSFFNLFANNTNTNTNTVINNDIVIDTDSENDTNNTNNDIEIDSETDSNTNAFVNLTKAFEAAAKISSEENLINGVTWNGDSNFSSLGLDYKSALLALDQKAITTKESHKIKKLTEDVEENLNNLFDTFINCTRSLGDVERGKAFNLLFRYFYYVRSIRVPGKKSRLLFYYLFNKLYAIFPKTCIALLELVPDFGYFRDLDAIIKLMSNKREHKLQLCNEYSLYPGVVNAAINVYIKHLNADCILIFGKPLVDVTYEEADELNLKLRPKTFDEIKEFVGSKHLSLAAKWVKRENKSIHRLDMVLAIYDRKNEIPYMIATDLYSANRRINYYQMVFRNVISTLTQCLLVGEPMMCNGSKDHKYRSYGDIKTAHMPAKYITKYCKALGNEDLKESISESEHFTGNRYPDDEDRVACRQDLLKTIFDGKLKGASQDIGTLSEIIFNSFSDNEYSNYGQKSFQILPSLSALQRKVISSQWNDIVNKLKDEIIVAIESAKASATESGEQFNNPQNIVPIVDTSGSMRPVQDKAIALGILASSLSTIPGVLIAFSEVPSVYYLDMSPDKDVFDHFQTIMNGPTGLSTNIDKTYQCMLDIMKNAQLKSSDCDFSMLYLTDGQFDSDVVQSNSKLDKTALGRMNNIFVSSGFNVLPKIIFWNLNERSPGFPASANTTGVQLVSGYSQSLMFQVFTGNYKYVEQEDGTIKADVDPWTLFEKALLHEGYDPVSRIVANIGEGCLTTLSND